MGNHLFWSSDHLGREWSARAEFHKGPSQWVEVWITCVRDQKTVLSQTAAWCPALGWDMRRPWYPRAPRPVPEATLAKIEGWLRSLAQQQQGEAIVADQIRKADPLAPIDLDALLSPEGPYMRSNGHEDNAQLVDHFDWWAPVYGCDTLDILLNQIRDRILPHLRPPIAGIDVPGPDGDYGDLQELCDAEGVDVRIGAPLLRRAREAWKVAAQPLAPAAVPIPDPPQGGDAEREELADELDEDGRYLVEVAFARECNKTWRLATRVIRAAQLLRQSPQGGEVQS